MWLDWLAGHVAPKGWHDPDDIDWKAAYLGVVLAPDDLTTPPEAPRDE